MARLFANHPGAREAAPSALVYRPEADKNPVLRGFPLVIASTLISNSGYLQKLLWENAKFGHPKNVVCGLGLGGGGEFKRLTPNVIPLTQDDDGQQQQTQSMLDINTTELTTPPPQQEGRFWSAADYHTAYKNGQVTPVQVVEALLPLISRDETGKGGKYSVAWLQTNPSEVLAAARESTQRYAEGKPLGILDGVPFGVKDDTDVEGFVSTMGMRVADEEGYFKKPAAETTWPVRKLQEQGAIMVGKMNQHEIGMDTSGCNPSTGTPQNWYNTSYYPGGSSSGAGSALSGGVVPICVGTDAGGSVRVPASFCGVYGLKTTHNRTVTRNSSVCVVAPMAATVADLTVAYRVMSQPNPSDPSQSMLAVSTHQEGAVGRKKVLGVCREWIDAKTSPAVLEHFQKAVGYLTSQEGGGYEIVEIKLPYLREGQLAHGATCLTEAADNARSRAQDPNRYLGLLNYPNRILVATGSQTPAVDMLKYGQIRQTIMQHLAHLWERHPGMLILTSTTPLAGWPIHAGDQAYGFGDGNKSILNMTYVWYANTSGCPAVSCPVGYAEPQQGEGKLPVGLMALGEWGAEEQLLGFARETEVYLNEKNEGGRLRPKEWVDVIGLAKGSGKVGGDSTA